MNANRLAALGFGISLALLVTLVVVWRRWPTDAPPSGADEQARAEAVRQLVQASSGSFDSHVDPEVGHVLLPGIEGRELRGQPLSTNRLGLREEEFATPKPPGLVRVVLLGDSLVFGEGARAEERHGALLERWLDERKGASAPEVEVLHVGVSSWNLVGECVYLSRSLALIDPDLVLHVSTGNDLDDVAGVRGFGAMARFSPARRAAADGRFGADHPRVELGLSSGTPFILGLDHISRTRWDAARGALWRLHDVLRERGARYLHVLHWAAANPLAAEELELGGELLAIPKSIASDRALWISASDPHWNAEGMRLIAELLWTSIRARDLLPELALAPWPEVEARAAAHIDEGAAEVAPGAPLAARLSAIGLDGALSFEPFDERDAAHLYGGVRANGELAREAALVVRPNDAHSIQLAGQHLERPELDGATLEIWLEEQLALTLTVDPGARVEHSIPIPEALRERDLLSLRFVADEHVLSGAALDRTACFRLLSIRCD